MKPNFWQIGLGLGILIAVVSAASHSSVRDPHRPTISSWDYWICGKFANDKLAFSKFDIKLDGKIGFAVQEAPSSIVFAIVYFYYWDQINAWSLLYFILWEIHYIHRAFIYTFIRQKSCNQTNLSVVVMAFFFTAVNGYLTAKFALLGDSGHYSAVSVVIGVLMFVFGFILNYSSDEILLNLRKPGDKGYYIPFGWPYNFVSCPNYLGEIIEWAGLFLAFRTLAGAAFVVNTCANLVPRAINTHKWYLGKFGEKYPRERRAIFPFLL